MNQSRVSIEKYYNKSNEVDTLNSMIGRNTTNYKEVALLKINLSKAPQRTIKESSTSVKVFLQSHKI